MAPSAANFSEALRDLEIIRPRAIASPLDANIFFELQTEATHQAAGAREKKAMRAVRVGTAQIARVRSVRWDRGRRRRRLVLVRPLVRTPIALHVVELVL